jgi:hypothetical protein
MCGQQGVPSADNSVKAACASQLVRKRERGKQHTGCAGLNGEHGLLLVTPEESGAEAGGGWYSAIG